MWKQFYIDSLMYMFVVAHIGFSIWVLSEFITLHVSNTYIFVIGFLLISPVQLTFMYFKEKHIRKNIQ